MQSSDMPDAPEMHGNGKRKKVKMYKIEWRSTKYNMWKDWTTYKKYETEDDMNKAINAIIGRDNEAKRKNPEYKPTFEYRVSR